VGRAAAFAAVDGDAEAAGAAVDDDIDHSVLNQEYFPFSSPFSYGGCFR